MSTTTLDRSAHALADPTRREILRVVRDRECTAGTIAANFPISRPAISQHLRVLRDAELVTVRHEGTRRYYRSDPDALTELRAWLEDFWTGALDRLTAEAELEHARRSGATDG